MQCNIRLILQVEIGVAWIAVFFQQFGAAQVLRRLHLGTPQPPRRIAIGCGRESCWGGLDFQGHRIWPERPSRSGSYPELCLPTPTVMRPLTPPHSGLFLSFIGPIKSHQGFGWFLVLGRGWALLLVVLISRLCMPCIRWCPSLWLEYLSLLPLVGFLG